MEYVATQIIFFRSYLSNRSQFTVINGVESSIKKITCGVPQGSVLGPILFLIYVNDIHRCVTNCKTRLFADDTSLTICHKDPTELKNIATTQIKNLIKWCNSNKLTINLKKTKYIIFHTRKLICPKHSECFICSWTMHANKIRLLN